ncbi:MAG: CaiB/BaiF CoA-transferase family protein [Actinomycetota bacterium]
MPGPLAGIKVLDFSRLAPGPYGAMLLADMGADVIRVDRPGDGGISRFGDVVGRGKRSVALNLKEPASVEIAMKILEGCDVLVEGFRPGVMERLGLGPDDVAARNPKVVYARLTGWGQDGPLALRAGHDINYIAVSGVLHAIGRAGEPPVPPLNLIGDFAGGGLMCAFGILCALIERQTSGKGQVVDAAMVDGAMNLLSFLASAIHAEMWGPHGTNMLDTGAHFYEVYETSDGGYMSVGAIEPQFYAEWVDGLGVTDDEQFKRQHDTSLWPELKKRTAEIFKTKTRDEWSEIFTDRDACTYPVLSPKEAPSHPFNAERKTHVVGGFDVVQPAPAPRLSRTPGAVGDPSPEIGGHTAEVLKEIGYSDDEITKLADTGAIGIASS